MDIAFIYLGLISVSSKIYFVATSSTVCSHYSVVTQCIVCRGNNKRAGHPENISSSSRQQGGTFDLIRVDIENGVSVSIEIDHVN